MHIVLQLQRQSKEVKNKCEAHICSQIIEILNINYSVKSKIIIIQIINKFSSFATRGYFSWQIV